jgi:two-component system, OmpR family, response regulator
MWRRGAGEILATADLRRCGWVLVSAPRGSELLDGEFRPDCPLVVDGNRLDAGLWMLLIDRRGVRLRRRVLLLNIHEAKERSYLLRLGFGDVMGGDVALPEVEARAERIAALADTMQRFLYYGPLKMDLLARDGFVGMRRMGLHPREFALLWRLMKEPGEEIDKPTLLRDVWRLSFIPETNTLAVHIRRLRRKLAVEGLVGVIVTLKSGGYQLRPYAREARPDSKNSIYFKEVILDDSLEELPAE